KKDVNLCVVGDDDQSIYRFRGPTIENILMFEERFDNATVIKLERNYRSTQTILDAANHVIANNVGRKSKSLWTENGKGQTIAVCCAYDEGHEADTIAAAIEKLHNQQGVPYNECAVLYRTNAQSRAIEGAMRSHRIPARVIGGQSFFDRKEVKDIMSYLCQIVNPTDDLRLRRIINEPKRAIGDTTVAAVAAVAEAENCSMLEACRRADEYPSLSRAREKLKGFAMMMVDLIAYNECNPLNTLIEEVLERTGYAEALKSDESFEDRIENIAELNSAIVRYMQGEENPTLFGFLERTSLLSDADDYEQADESVALMTMHTAKGLEFNHVFLPGMEEGLFPSSMSLDEDGGIEEERRLCYVGITRAKKTLTLLYTRMRMLYGTTLYPQMSRFIDEIPQELYVKSGAPEGERQAEQRARNLSPQNTPSFTLRQAANARPTTKANAPMVEYVVGEQVKHRVFGVGTILSVKPMANDCMLEIQFGAQIKKIMANYANLQKI
ncbi:MAG: ATP-binding domain-containing protein, partial [Clostridia bacterium]|nr:ATP-binding domain-containing protein [Clostridia bacterium]